MQGYKLLVTVKIQNFWVKRIDGKYNWASSEHSRIKKKCEEKQWKSVTVFTGL